MFISPILKESRVLPNAPERFFISLFFIFLCALYVFSYYCMFFACMYVYLYVLSLSFVQVSREVRVSILASSLVQRRISPNFVQTFGLFRSAAPLPAKVPRDVTSSCGLN